MGCGSTTFVIAVPDQRGVADWTKAMQLLRETTDSCARQIGPRPIVLVAASRGAALPLLPGVEIVEIDREYRPLPPKWDAPRQAAIRADKGARVAAALTQAQPCGHVMVVDWDDLVSPRIAKHVAENPNANGWFVESGLIFDTGPLVLTVPEGMNRLCGTTLIIRSDLMRVPTTLGAADDQWVASMYGSHIRARQILNDSGNPLEPLPFHGAAYRVGTGVNGSYRSSVIRTALEILPRRRIYPRLRPRLRLGEFSV